MGSGSCGEVSVPATTDFGLGQDVVVPITVTNAVNVIGMDFVLTYDSTKFTATSVSATPSTSGWTLMSNLRPAGQITIGMYSGTPLNGTAQVAWIVFHAIGNEGDTSALRIHAGRPQRGPADLA